MSDITITIPARVVKLTAVLAPSALTGIVLYSTGGLPEAVMGTVVTIGALAALLAWLYPNTNV